MNSQRALWCRLVDDGEVRIALERKYIRALVAGFGDAKEFAGLVRPPHWMDRQSLAVLSKRKHPQNILHPEFVTNSLTAFMDYHGASRAFIVESVHGLVVAQFRVFDWLAMCVMGRAEGEHDRNVLKALVGAYYMGRRTELGFQTIVVGDDLDLDRRWERIPVSDLTMHDEAQAQRVRQGKVAE